ncbi:death-associated protein 1 isoform X1 [Gymnodraco acuticeps]|uniref:Death-associated protein 1 isoform X1 n=1 Tax=Gymnodraco acuticeps TaxID=8218 RepID=A0A6P8TU60_GYMAC|nr:death-associated protein 1 isoform X1 [Gymnodraco acuticeps]
MSSPPKEKMEKVETKGGHLPAVKAGGMRIVQKHQPVAAAAPEPVPKDDEEEDEEEYVSSSPPKVPVIVSGVVTKVSHTHTHTHTPTPIWDMSSTTRGSGLVLKGNKREEEEHVK